MSVPEGMGSLSYLLTGLQPAHQKSISLVKKIAEKTKAGRITWKKSSTGFIASVRGGLELGFVPAGLLGFGGSVWGIFTVRDRDGNEILRVENPSSSVTPLAFSSLGVLPTPDPLVSAVSELYNQVGGAAATDIDRAITLVDGA